MDQILYKHTVTVTQSLSHLVSVRYVRNCISFTLLPYIMYAYVHVHVCNITQRTLYFLTYDTMGYGTLDDRTVVTRVSRVSGCMGLGALRVTDMHLPYQPGPDLPDATRPGRPTTNSQRGRTVSLTHSLTHSLTLTHLLSHSLSISLPHSLTPSLTHGRVLVSPGTGGADVHHSDEVSGARSTASELCARPG
jgi:hypothetical protein